MRLTNEEIKDKTERIWKILIECKSPSGAISLLSGILASFAFQHCNDPENIKLAVLKIVEEALELNKHVENDNEPDDAA